MVSPACMLMLDVICVFASCLLPANGFAALYGLCLHQPFPALYLLNRFRWFTSGGSGSVKQMTVRRSGESCLKQSV